MSGDCSMEGLQIVVQRSGVLYLWPEADNFSFFPSLSGSHFKILSFVGNIDLKKKKTFNCCLNSSDLIYFLIDRKLCIYTTALWRKEDLAQL